MNHARKYVTKPYMLICDTDRSSILFFLSLNFFLTQLFEVVKGMPAFMLTNGLLKVICQVISIATDHTHLSAEDKELILNDILHMCKLVIIFAIRYVY